MRSVLVATLLVASACGRVGFDATMASGGSGSGTLDAPRADDSAISDGTTGVDADLGVPCSGAACPCSDDCTESCVSGRCDLTCDSASNCTFYCDAAPCDITCDQAANCDVSCAAGGCTYNGIGGADIIGSCSGLGCTGTCDGTAMCKVTCGATGCACSGQGCS